MTPREVRIRVQAMIDQKAADKLKKAAERNGISVSAMAAILINKGLESTP